MEESYLSEIDGLDLDDMMLPPPPLIRRNAYMEEEQDDIENILTSTSGHTYQEEECPICFCSLDETNTAKLLCGHVLCHDDLNNLMNLNEKHLKCHICRTLQIYNSCVSLVQ